MRFALGFLTALALLSSTAFGLKVGEAAPSFSLPNLKGEIVDLSQYLSREAVVLSFFASWSKPCQEEIKFLKALHEQYGDKGLRIITVSFDRKSKDLESFARNHKLDFEILRDKKLSTLDEFQILIIPTMMVIDSAGVLQNIYVDFDENVEKAAGKEIKDMVSASSPLSE